MNQYRNVCLHKQTADKFSKFLRLPIPALPDKVLQEVQMYSIRYVPYPYNKEYLSLPNKV
jgi:hypothetical protein